MRLIQKGNSKLHDSYMFNLPASHEVCGRLCKGCYAHREQVRFPRTNVVREARYKVSQHHDFSSYVITELSKLRQPPRWFRIHASGEFYSQTYVDHWTAIVSAFPNIGFYAYTKRLKDFDFSALKSLPNMALIDSFHFGSINYGPLSSVPTGAFVCPSSPSIRCGVECTWCHQPGQADAYGVYFEKH